MPHSTRPSVALFAIGLAAGPALAQPPPTANTGSNVAPIAAYELGKQGLTGFDQRQMPIRKLTIEPGAVAGFHSQWV